MVQRILSALAFALVSASVAHATPMAFQHTGRLLDAAGTPVNNEATVTVSLSETQGGTAFWSQDFPNTDVQDGYFAVEVGAGPPALTPVALERDEVWLSTSFDGGESTGSQRLLAVPYAARAEVANTVDSQGAVVQMATVQTRAQATYSAPNSGTGTAIAPLDIVLTPRKAGNHVLLEWTLNGEIHHDTVWLVTRNGVPLPQTTNGSNHRWAGTSLSVYDNNYDSTPSTFIVKIVDTNSLDTQSTYRVHARSSSGGNYTFYLNRTYASLGTNAYESSLSLGVATEIWQAP